LPPPHKNIVPCKGKITAENSEVFQRQIRDLIAESHAQIATVTRRIIVDLSNDPLHPELANCEIDRGVYRQEVNQAGNLQCGDALLRKSRQRQPLPGVATAYE